MQSAAAAKSLQSYPTVCDPIDSSPPGFPHPWDSPGKNSGVGCHFLLQYMKVKSESEVTQSCLTQRPHGLQPTRLLHLRDFFRQEYWSGVPLPSPLYAEYIMRNPGLEEAQAGIKNAGRKKRRKKKRLPGEISITWDMQMILPIWQKVKKN